MAAKKSPSGGENRDQTREDRLKAALRANLARRKAQMRARADSDAQGASSPGETDGQPSTEADNED
ncbi:MAG: hypothetical protein AAGF79_07900 [Pseudomonadota bacterium]